MVSLSWGVLVKVSEVNCTARSSVMFGNNHHAVLPSSRGVYWHSLKNTQCTIPIQPRLDRQLPVERDLGRNVDSYWFDIMVKVELERWTSFHEGKLLFFTAVES